MSLPLHPAKLSHLEPPLPAVYSDGIAIHRPSTRRTTKVQKQRPDASVPPDPQTNTATDSVSALSILQPGTYARHSCLEPYGLECIAAALLQSGQPVQLCSVRSASYKLVPYLEVASRFLLFSSYTSDHAEVAAVAQSLKQDRPASVAILGGHHASAVKSLAAVPPFDYVIVGEGEDSVCALVEALLDNSPVKTPVPGVIARGLTGTFPSRPRISNLNRLPLAVRDEATLQSSRIYALAYPPPSAQTGAAQITYSRGCPFSCPYCASPLTWGRHVFWRDPAEVAREARMLTEDYQVNMLLFTDLAFNHREDRVIPLCDQLDAQQVGINWHVMCAFAGTSLPVLRRMAASGCTKIGWGIEALTDRSLRHLEARQSFQTIQATLAAAASVGVINRAYLMIGYPWQTRSELKESLNLLSDISVDELTITFYTPFPGTRAYEHYRPKLRSEDFSLFDTDHPVLDAADMSAEELIDARRSIFARFYGSSAYALRRAQKVRHFPHLKQSYDELFAFLHQRGVLQ